MTHALAPCRNYGVIPDARTHTKTRILLGNAPRVRLILWLAMLPLLHAGQLAAQTQLMNTYETVSPTGQHNPHIAQSSNPPYTISMWEIDEDRASKYLSQGIDNSYGLPQKEALDGARVRGGGGNEHNPRAVYDSHGHVFITPGYTP